MKKLSGLCGRRGTTRIRGTQNNGGTSAHQVNQGIRHPRTTFGAVVVNVNKRFVSADARAFIPNYVLCVDIFNSKRSVEGYKPKGF